MEATNLIVNGDASFNGNVYGIRFTDSNWSSNAKTSTSNNYYKIGSVDLTNAKEYATCIFIDIQNIGTSSSQGLYGNALVRFAINKDVGVQSSVIIKSKSLTKDNFKIHILKLGSIYEFYLFVNETNIAALFTSIAESSVNSLGVIDNAVSIEECTDENWISTPSGTLSDTIFEGLTEFATRLETARQIALTGAVTGSVNFDGTNDVIINTSVNHTHDYLPSGGTAVAANKLATERSITLSGQVTGSATFDGTKDVTINVTTVKVNGEAATANSARHVWFSDTNVETKRNFNDNFVYNPSTQMLTTNISGNAASASKLATARKITLTGAVTGEANFDGSQNVSITTTVNHTHSYLPLTGGTLTGDINIKKGATNMAPIRTYEGDANGGALVIEYGGATYIGSGEAGSSLKNALGISNSNETLIIGSDDIIRIFTNCQTIANRKEVTIDATGKVTAVGGFSGALSGNANSATTATYLSANVMPANANFNSYTTPGFYYCGANATVSTMTNRPTGNAFFMIVGKHAGVSQTVFEYMTSGFKIYHRNSYNGTWGSWVRIYTTIDKPTASEVGAAAASHTHSYAGSASVGGAANSALKANALNVHSTVTDMNAIGNENGLYPFGSESMKNAPATSLYGVVFQLSNQNTPTGGTSNHWITQLAFATNGNIYRRHRVNTGSWGAWSSVSFTYTAVKGNAESSYRTGNVNLTPANLGALPTSGGTMTGALVAQANTSYTTAQVRNITMSTSAPSGGVNGQIHFQYT